MSNWDLSWMIKHNLLRSLQQTSCTYTWCYPKIRGI